MNVDVMGRTTGVAAIAKALSDPVRVEILEALREAEDGELCQCHLQPRFAIGQPTLSHHLRKLTDAGLVTVERRGRWAYYAIDDRALDPLRAWLR